MEVGFLGKNIHFMYFSLKDSVPTYDSKKQVYLTLALYS